MSYTYFSGFSRGVNRIFSIALLALGTLAQAAIPTHDRGPDLKTEMGRELHAILTSVPDFEGVGKAAYGDAYYKFRRAFGDMPIRSILVPNSVKILFIGQDGTHIAEAAGRPATAGFGGRAQHMATYFGVYQSVAFMNAMASTIAGQAALPNTPIFVKRPSGDIELSFASFVPNKFWMLTQDLRSPIVQWRNKLIDWILRNNSDSLRLVVLFGGAARDTMANFIISRGGHVPPDAFWERKGEGSPMVPHLESVGTGGNGEMAFPLNLEGRDLYADVLGKKVNYKTDQDSGERTSKDVQAAQSKMEKEAAVWFQKARFSPKSSGFVNPAQIGGYALEKLSIDGRQSISLRGLVLSDKRSVKNDVLVTDLPHPTALTATYRGEMMKASLEALGGEEAAKTATEEENDAAAIKGKEAAVKKVDELVQKKLQGVRKFVEAQKSQGIRRPWNIAADPGQTNHFASRGRYVYDHAQMGPESYDFGSPASRRVPVSDAVRLNASQIIFGTRDKEAFQVAETFDKQTKQKISDPDESAKLESIQKINEILKSQPSEEINPNENFVSRHRLAPQAGSFDPGPDEKLARQMREALNVQKIVEAMKARSPRSAMARDLDTNEDYGHYRGSLKKASVLVVADPFGYDDLSTSRALTGARGQYLQTYMKEIGVPEDYLVVKTVPFSMEHATAEDWEFLLEQTETYRKVILNHALRLEPKKIIADGPYAQQVLKSLGVEFTSIERDGTAMGGIPISHAKVMTDIPRKHLPYYSRVWDGRGGDHVVGSMASVARYTGKAFMLVAPNWVTKSKAVLLNGDEEKARELGAVLKELELQ